jgi:gliding motility-associated-like protein
MLEDGSIQLSGQASGNGLIYLWTPNVGLDLLNIATPTAAPIDDITYTLTVTSIEGCHASDQVFVKVLRKPIIPNAFSPNGDAVNDTWVIKYLDAYPDCTVDIYDRAGQRVYYSAGYGKPWDGRLNGNALPIGTYYYIINPHNGRKTETGSVTIIR